MEEGSSGSDSRRTEERKKKTETEMVSVLLFSSNNRCNLITYTLVESQYQIVAGTNVWVKLRSKDALQFVEAIIFVDLSMNPQLIEFHATYITPDH